MEAKNTKILEALQLQPLSDEEKASRHILGRLYGPIATTKEKTRNGRSYNKELWERALADEIFREKVANKSLFLELGHPAGREETDMEKVCACIPELPKVVDGDLYAYVDILDTNNGRLLKTLCDYGFVPGISSRGSGDVMANDEVDPTTFFLETWDIVQLPALKKARLTVCESLGSKTLAMALRESLEKATETEKAEIKESLNKLNIHLDESVETETDNDVKTDEDTEIDENDAVTETPAESDVEEVSDEDLAKVDPNTVAGMIALLQEYPEDLNIEFKPLVIEDKEYEVTELNFEDSDDDKVIVNINYNLSKETAEEDNKLPEDENPKVDIEVSSDEEPAPKKEVKDSEEAVDDGEDELFESLKEMVRQKDLLESEVRRLKNQGTVSDAKVKDLQEQLEKYKTGFMRVSELAAKSTVLTKEVRSLKEQLSVKDLKITDLQTKIKSHTNLTESANADKAKVKTLTEKLIAIQTEAEKSEEALRTKLSESRKAAQTNANIAKRYKERCTALTERYIAMKANMLGVRSTDITSRLAENYTLDDIDQVCDNLLDMGRPAFGLGLGKPKITITESKVTAKQVSPVSLDQGYEIDDDLLILAGLK